MRNAICFSVIALILVIIIVATKVTLSKTSGKSDVSDNKAGTEAVGTEIENTETESTEASSENKDSEAESTESATESTSETENTETETASTDDATSETASENSTGSSESLPAQTFGSWDISSLSSENVPYGFNRSDTDSTGRPTGIQYYINKYSQYKVDFISDRTDNVVYLTMDEGFANEQTSQVLDILKEKNVKVTFFCTTDFVTNCPDLLTRMINEGHRIGSHSKTHRQMPTLDLATQEEEIMDVVNFMKNNYDYDVRLFRFPEGQFSEQSLALVENLGLKSVFWSFAYGDYSSTQPDVAESLNLTLSCVHPGAIYLLHANSSTNLSLLSDFIDGVRAKGYEFGGVYPVD